MQIGSLVLMMVVGLGLVAGCQTYDDPIGEHGTTARGPARPWHMLSCNSSGWDCREVGRYEPPNASGKCNADRPRFLRENPGRSAVCLALN
jgi:hypothetical protein